MLSGIELNHAAVFDAGRGGTELTLVCFLVGLATTHWAQISTDPPDRAACAVGLLRKWR